MEEVKVPMCVLGEGRGVLNIDPAYKRVASSKSVNWGGGLVFTYFVSYARGTSGSAEDASYATEKLVCRTDSIELCP